MTGNSFDTLNTSLSIRKFLYEAIYTKLQIPVISGLSRQAQELTADRYVLYYIESRPETPGIPARNIDLTIHVRTKFAAIPTDTDGKSVTIIADFIRSRIQNATEYQNWPTDILLYDYTGLFASEAILLAAVTSGDITEVLTTLQGTPKPIGCFWMDKIYQEKIERLDTEFSHARNYRLFQYSPDMVRMR